MSNGYLRAFVIASSAFVFLPFFLAVSQFKKTYFNFDYVYYSFLAPIALGFMNVFSLFIADTFQLSKVMRYLFISLLAPTLVSFTIVIFKIYNYTKTQWVNHIIKLYLFYFVIWNLIVYNLDKYI
jgi:hypothetical protein